MTAVQSIDTQTDRFWPAATRTTVALAVAAGAARADAGRADTRARIVALCRDLTNLAGEESDGRLVAAIAASLGDFVGQAGLDEPALEVIAGHLEALRAVVRHAIGGDGGLVGRAIMAGLQASVARYGTADA